ncbi:hypothetical protein DBR21_16650 [Caulobacter sp. HMWF009]|nr:hypothetical protein DBR21_16650 [Caulobacter sp. HMWF009]PTT12098.1 hypothetical protein DBR10_02295 [Caulobacter sp. HMWF025]
MGADELIFPLRGKTVAKRPVGGKWGMINRAPFPCHPGRSVAESRDPGATAVRRPLGPGAPALRASGRDDKDFGR